jgi:trimethyllysine dioxygenase
LNPYHKVNLTHLSEDQVKRYYKAIKNLSKIVRDPSNETWLSLNPDQVLIFDNFRLMHGRSSFNGERALNSMYLSRDDWLSKAEILLENQ